MSTDLQNVHTVCTLPGQRNAIDAPQLGQFAPGWLIGSLEGAMKVPALLLKRNPEERTEHLPSKRKTDFPALSQNPNANDFDSRTGSGKAIRAQGRCGTQGAIQPAGTIP
jgi:hypothetical protein